MAEQKNETVMTQQNKTEIAWHSEKQQEWQKEHARIKHCLDNNIPVSNYPPPPLKPTTETKSTGGVKYDSGKPDLSHISLELMVQVARVREFGEKKYSRDNWRKGFSYNRSLAAALRHIMAFKEGQDLDTESGLSHIAHAICCLEHLLNDIKNHPENDDR